MSDVVERSEMQEAVNNEQVPAVAGPVEDLRPYFQTVDDLAPGVLDWGLLFGNAHPVELEVGCGRGLFLTNAGQMHRERNFLGIEYDYKEARRAARRLMKRGLQNVRIFGANANFVLPQMIADHSIETAHVYFPDPWWKRRHRPRRIFQVPFVAQLARILKSGGLLHSWTDVEEYFGVICKLVDANPEFERQPPPEERAPTHDMDYHTSFERKKRKEGLRIFRACWRRR